MIKQFNDHWSFFCLYTAQSNTTSYSAATSALAVRAAWLGVRPAYEFEKALLNPIFDYIT